jgi:hypothetical protein
MPETTTLQVPPGWTYDQYVKWLQSPDAQGTPSGQAFTGGLATVPNPNETRTQAAANIVPKPDPLANAQGGAATVAPPVTSAPGAVVPPPSGVPAVQPATPVTPAAVESVPPSGTPSFEDQIKEIMGRDQGTIDEFKAKQKSYIDKGLATGDWSANDQTMLDLANKSATGEADRRTVTAQKEASAIGLRDSTYVVRRMVEESGLLSQKILDNELAFRQAAMGRGAAIREDSYNKAGAFVQAIKDNNLGLAQVLLEKYKTDATTGLNEKQFALQEKQIDAAIALGRDQFSEDVREQMIAEKFTETQINNAQNQLLWERTFKDRELNATTDLANKNYELQRKTLDVQASAESRRQALAELQNSQGYSLQQVIQTWKEKMDSIGVAQNQRDYDQAVKQFESQFGIEINKFALQAELERGQLALGQLTADREYQLQNRVQDLAAQLGLRGANLEEAKLAQLKDQVEREFGVRIDELELRKQIETGRLDLEIVNSQRKYDLDVTQQRNEWLQSQQSLDLQRTLGLGELELRKYLGDQQTGVQMEQISVQREQQVIEKYMFDQGLAWDKEKLRIQIAEARKKAKGSFFGKLIKGIVGAGMAVAGGLTGNPALIAAGINTFAGAAVTQPADWQRSSPTSPTSSTPGAGGAPSSAGGNFTTEYSSYQGAGGQHP